MGVVRVKKLPTHDYCSHVLYAILKDACAKCILEMHQNHLHSWYANVFCRIYAGMQMFLKTLWTHIVNIPQNFPI